MIPTLTIGSEIAGSWSATTVPSQKGTALAFTADATSDVVTIAGAGWTIPSGAIVRFTTDGTLPAGLAAYRDYYTERLTDTTFKVHSKPDVVGGTIVDITDAGMGTHTATLDSASAQVIARHSYQQITPGGDYTATVLVAAYAFHINGVPTARCGVNGTFTDVPAYEKATIDGQDYHAYFAYLPVSGTDKRVEIRWEFTPQHAGLSRVLQGEPPSGQTASTYSHWDGLSLYANSNAGGNLPRWHATIDADNGSDGTGALQTTRTAADTTPYQTILAARDAYRLKEEASNGALSTLGNTSNVGLTCWLKEASGISDTYAPADASTLVYNWRAEWLIDSHPSNIRQIYLTSPVGNINGWKAYCEILRIGPGVKWIVTVPGIQIFAGNAEDGKFTETIIFDCSEFYDPTVVAAGVNWYICDSFGLGLTGASFDSSNGRLTKTGAFAGQGTWDRFARNIRFTDTGTGTTYQCRIYEDTFATSDYVTLGPEGSGFDPLPTGNIADITTVGLTYRYSPITGTHLQHIIFRNCHFHHIHNSAAGDVHMERCEVDYELQHTFEPKLLVDCYAHDFKQITAEPGLHMDGPQWGILGSAAAIHDSNSIIVRCRWTLPEQPFNHQGWRKNIAIVANIFAAEGGQTDGNKANVLSRQNDHQYQNHFLFLDNTMPSNFLDFQAPTATYKPTMINALVASSIMRIDDTDGYYDDGINLTDTGNGSVRTPFVVLYRDVVTQSTPTVVPYNSWGTGNWRTVDPLGYSSLTAPATAGNYDVPAALAATGSTDLSFDVFNKIRNLAVTAPGAVASAAEANPSTAGPGFLNSPFRFS